MLRVSAILTHMYTLNSTKGNTTTSAAEVKERSPNRHAQVNKIEKSEVRRVSFRQGFPFYKLFATSENFHSVVCCCSFFGWSLPLDHISAITLVSKTVL